MIARLIVKKFNADKTLRNKKIAPLGFEPGSAGPEPRMIGFLIFP
jgi:hypothetical protein